MAEAEQTNDFRERGQARVRRAVPVSLSSLIGLVLLAGCSSSPPTSPTGYTPAAQMRSYPGYKIGNPYKIKGVWYYPKLDYDYDEVGIASWYGPGFHGKATANGEIYDQDDMTAAHKTLPMPSIVRVTNLENGRSIKVRVNDRGPFVDGRIIDLSRRGAQSLGFYGAGTARVRVDVEEEESRNLAIALTGTDDPTGQLALSSRRGGQPPSPPLIPVPPINAAPTSGMSSLAVAEPLAGPIDTAEVPLAVASVPEVGATPQTLPNDSANSLASQPALDGDAVSAEYSAAGSVPNASGDDGYQPAGTPLNPWQQPSFRQPAWKQASWQPSNTLAGGLDGRAYVQCGAFSDRGNAERAHRQLARLGPVSLIPHSVGGQSLYRVRVGPLSSLDEAGRIQAAAAQAGFTGSHVVIE